MADKPAKDGDIQTLGDAMAELDRLRAALAGYGRDPQSCVEEGPCVSHMAYLESEAEVTRLRAALAVVADPLNWRRYGTIWPIWNGTGEYADPMAWAKSIQEDDR